MCSEDRYEIGTIVRDGRVTDQNLEWQTVTFQVLAEATRDEYEAYAVATTGMTEFDPMPYYYRVSMD